MEALPEGSIQAVIETVEALVEMRDALSGIRVPGRGIADPRLVTVRRGVTDAIVLSGQLRTALVKLEPIARLIVQHHNGELTTQELIDGCRRYGVQP